MPRPVVHTGKQLRQTTIMSEALAAELDGLARAWGCTYSDVIRRLVQDAAMKEGGRRDA